LGEYDLAIEKLSKVLDMMGSQPYGHYARGLAYAQKGLEDKAEQDLEEALPWMIRALREPMGAAMFEYADDPRLREGRYRPTEEQILARMINRLRVITGQNFGYDADASAEENERAIAAWEDWFETSGQIKFTPDAVFIVTNAVQDKSLLFFLEVDCGTETLSSPQRDMSDIRQKILNYQWYFQSLKYKRYEGIFEVPHLHGFRVLFLAKTVGRLAALCKLTQEMQPSEFIFLTEQERLFTDGVFAKIWARSGNLQVAQRSIIGRLHCRTPLV